MKFHLTGIDENRRQRGDRQAGDGGYRPLSARQKAVLSILAKEAAEKLALGPAEAVAWRHEQALEACGRRISAAVQADWKILYPLFLQLAGKAGPAFNAHLREIDNKRRIAAWHLAKALQVAGLPAGYAAHICRDQYGVPVEKADAGQLWRLTYTIKSRTKQRNNRQHHEPN